MATRTRKTSKKNPPSEPAPPRATRSGGKGANINNDVLVGKTTTKITAKKASKRKMSDAPVDKANKRANKKVQEPNPVGDGERNETPSRTTGPAEQATCEPVVATKRARREELPRPKLSLDSESEEDDSSSDKNQSGIESDDEVTNLTAVNLRKECPTPAETAANDQNNGEDIETQSAGDSQPRGGKRLEKIIHEVPFLSSSANSDGVNNIPTTFVQPIHQPVYSPPHNFVLPHPPNTVVLPFKPAALPSPMFHPLPPAWPAATDLVRRDDGHYRHSDQMPEIQACLSGAVQRANSNLVFLDAFPDAVRKGQWLAHALERELNIRLNGSTAIAVIADRAQRDQQYFNDLQSMITGRWSGFRQGVIDMARALIISQDSTYHLWRDPNQVTDPQEVPQAARNLLEGDGYHFTKTAAGVVDTTTPYQHLEIAIALTHYFKGREAVGIQFNESIPTGAHGFQVPDAMVALTTTAVQVALEEKVAGRTSPFSEKAYREKYRNHIQTINVVKAWGDNSLRYTRMMSTIYKRTMDCLENGRPTPKAINSITVDVGRMAV